MHAWAILDVADPEERARLRAEEIARLQSLPDYFGRQSQIDDLIEDALADAEAAIPAYERERRESRRLYWQRFDRHLIREAERLGVPIESIPEMEKAMSQAVTRINQRTGQMESYEFSESQINLIRNTIAKGATDGELQLFINVSQRLGLDPFAREIYAIPRQGRMTIQIGIDGLRKKAQESGTYAGQVGPFWCGEDEVWKDVWLSRTPPAAAKVGVIRHGETEPTWGVAVYTEFFQPSNQLWKDKPSRMLAKCAEAEALRKACPAERAAIRVAVLEAGAQYDDTLQSGDEAIEGDVRELEEPHTQQPTAATEGLSQEARDQYTVMLSRASAAGIATDEHTVDFDTVTKRDARLKYQALRRLVEDAEAKKAQPSNEAA